MENEVCGFKNYRGIKMNPNPIRWKYSIFGTHEGDEHSPILWCVVVRGEYELNYCSAREYARFASADLKECQLWIEQKEREGGYALPI